VLSVVISGLATLQQTLELWRLGARLASRA
jgi:hypothetical protein